MNWFLIALSFCIWLGLAQVEANNHSQLNGHQIWWLLSSPANASLIKTTCTNLQNSGKIDILGSSPNGDVHIRVYPDKINYTLNYLANLKLNPIIKIQNVSVHLQQQDAIVTRAAVIATATCTAQSCPLPYEDSYMTFDQMGFYLSSIAKNYSSLVNVTSIGLTAEGRNIWLVNIRNKTIATRKSIWIEGGIHAREWISSAVALLLIRNLLQNATYVQDFEYNIAPMVNPDGFVYTKTTDRLWRKNRARTTSCQGVDLNRNWAFHWGVGASTDPCTEIYQGTKPFSELETIALSKAMTNVKNLTLVIALHSYSQLLLYPWGWTTTVADPNKSALVGMGQIFINATNKVNNVIYAVVNSATGLYLASGTTSDWARGVLQANYSYTLELRDTGTYGFLLPSNQIKATGAETWAGFTAVINELQKN